jgi:hypothetical protein
VDGSLAEYDQILNGKRYYAKGLRDVKFENKVLKQACVKGNGLVWTEIW